MSFNPEVWASVANAAIFISLIIFPWAVEKRKKITGIIGFGGLFALLAFDFAVGYKSDDFGLASDLMMLTAVKGIFFLFTSMLVERVVRIYVTTLHNNKKPESAQDKAAKEKFEREMKAMKDRNEKFLNS